MSLLEADQLGSGEIDLNDPSLNDGVVEPDESVVRILPPGHGDEPEALAPLVVVDDLSVLHVAKLAKEHDQIVLPETMQSLKIRQDILEEVMISPVAEGNVGDVESLGKVWVTRESAHHGVVGVCPQLEHVLAHQRTGGGAGGQQELAGQGPGGQSSQSSEVETSGGSLLLTTARGEELLAGVAVELLGRAGHHGRPNSQVQLGGGG